MEKVSKNCNGSVLAFVIMVFAVLMVFGTFTISFMLNENSLSIRHNNKAQAFYYARSGVESVEKALIDRLSSYGNDSEQQSKFVERFDIAREIDVDLDFLDGPVIVKNEVINNKKVITVTTTVTVEKAEQTVKKAIYSTSSIISAEGFLPDADEFLVYLGDNLPQEKLLNGKFRSIPSEYVSKIPEEEKDTYKAYLFPSIDWNDVQFIENTFSPIESVNNIDSNKDILYSSGDLTLSEGMVFNGDFSIFVKGSLYIDGTVQFNGKTNIYVKDSVSFGNNSDLQGTKSNALNQLRILSYNGMTNSSFITGYNNGKFRIEADLYIDSRNVNFGFPQDAQIDGHIIYNGNQNVNIKTNSNSYNDRLITGSIYAPFGTVNLGFESYKVAMQLGGQVVGYVINVFPNNKNQGNIFYYTSTKNRIPNPIPINISTGIDTNSIRYESFFIEQ